MVFFTKPILIIAAVFDVAIFSSSFRLHIFFFFFKHKNIVLFFRAVAPMSSSSILTEHYGNHDSGYAASSFEVQGSAPNSPLKKSETELADFKNNNANSNSKVSFDLFKLIY